MSFVNVYLPPSNLPPNGEGQVPPRMGRDLGRGESTQNDLTKRH